MKTKPCLAALRLLAVVAVVATTRLLGAPLAAPAAVHTKPDASSPAISFLKAGAEPSAALNAPADLPAGWIAIELAGPFECYVENKDLTKALDVKPGTPLRLAPKADAAVLTIAEKGDKTSISGLKGKWTQLSLEKKLTGYVRVGAEPAFPAAAATQAGAPTGSTPAAPAPATSTTAGQAAQTTDVGDGGSSALPRQFAGRFVSTRRALAPRRPYDYALNDDAGKRYAYVDTSKLLLTEQIEKYIDKKVVVFGAAKPVPDTKDIVIMVETLRLQ
ncbi:MAG: hypothetical protein JNL92_04745 [Opitutaceae bacterium]|nr:hypothetical protein [Opitutaceae bacterium]